MTPEEIIFSPRAERDLKKLVKPHQKATIDALRAWQAGEKTSEVEKIKSQPDFYRFRAGGFRVIFTWLLPRRALVLGVKDRKDAYKNLGTLRAALASALESDQVVSAVRRASPR